MEVEFYRWASWTVAATEGPANRELRTVQPTGSLRPIPGGISHVTTSELVRGSVRGPSLRGEGAEIKPSIPEMARPKLDTAARASRLGYT
jgi:hypothetical protein